MANSGGMLKESIWRDRDFRALPRTAQTTYAQLLSQKELDRAGMLPLQVTKWAKGCDEITEADLAHDLKVLEERRFVFVDEDTDELLVRSYIRGSNVTSQPNLMKNALKCAGMVASDRLRHELAVELRRLRRADATKVADEIDPGEPHQNPSATHLEPIENPSETLPEGLNPSETLREPRGVGEGVGEDLLVSGDFREGARAGAGRANVPEPSEPPPPTCPKHPHGTDAPCRACGEARERRAEYDRTTAAASRAARRRAIADCQLCDEGGWRIEPSELRDHAFPAIRCDHLTPMSTAEWRALIPAEESADA